MSYRFMCDDLDRAASNRNIISKKLYIWAYLQVEAWLKDNPVTDLPYWMYSEGFVDERAKRRERNLTPEQRSEIARKAGRKGGIARAAKMTPKERSESARKASHSRKVYRSLTCV